MKIQLPVGVLLRCREMARVDAARETLGDNAPPPPFALMGRSDEGLELWQRDGHWREDKQPHRLDIVGIVQDGVPQPLTDQFEK